MTLFDVAVGLVLLASGIMAFVRGATREITTALALIAAVVIAVFGLRFTGPLARHAIATPWIANTAAVLILFIAAYIVLRVIGGAITRTVRQTDALSSLDRILGLGVGLVRGAVVVGVLTLLINSATPPERMPAWISKAKTYPAATAAANVLKAFAPEGLKMAHSVAPAMQDAVKAGTAGDPAKPPRGYSPDQRKSLDDLVEKSR
jgi:membrane protein required for colicin V production